MSDFMLSSETLRSALRIRVRPAKVPVLDKLAAIEEAAEKGTNLTRASRESRRLFGGLSCLVSHLITINLRPKGLGGRF